MVNTNSELELKKFDQWVRKRLDECKGDEDCYEDVWEQILTKIGDPSRKGRGYRITDRMSGFLGGAYKIIPGISPGRKTMRDSELRIESEVMLHKGK